MSLSVVGVRPHSLRTPAAWGCTFSLSGRVPEEGGTVAMAWIWFAVFISTSSVAADESPWLRIR